MATRTKVDPLSGCADSAKVYEVQRFEHVILSSSDCMLTVPSLTHRMRVDLSGVSCSITRILRMGLTGRIHSLLHESSVSSTHQSLKRYAADPRRAHVSGFSQVGARGREASAGGRACFFVVFFIDQHSARARDCCYLDSARWNTMTSPWTKPNARLCANFSRKAATSGRSRALLRKWKENMCSLVRGACRGIPSVVRLTHVMVLELKAEDEKEEKTMSESEKEDEVLSTLHETVQDVLKLICDSELIAQEVAHWNLDLKRLPLGAATLLHIQLCMHVISCSPGKLSKTQISQGYALLQQLSAALEEIQALSKIQYNVDDSTPVKRRGTRRSSRVKRPTNPTASQLRRLKESLKTLSSDFYTLIPHDFGRTLPPLIDSMDEVKLKIDLLEVLANIEISQQLEKEKNKNAKKKVGVRLNSLDAQYHLLNVHMEPLAESTDDFKIIHKCGIKQRVYGESLADAHGSCALLQTTHAPTHVQYKLRIKSVLKIARPAEDQFAAVFQSVGNHRLLWHGSRLSNIVGILSKGLRVAPPEAPNNGYMFGKGIYFADSVSKSANYCWTTPQHPKGVLLLAEVALGTPYHAREAEDLTYTTLKQAKGCDSTHGVGRMAAPEEEYETMGDGVVVPVGTFRPTEGGSLLYNEFIVYREEQVKLRYLVNLDFLYEEAEAKAKSFE
ncbi:hypothetical protein PsorP6_011479 [Peronosclerospora sorghi]|uniref:Uncharacterized protein n=1 Tax=Peronosclerospora sorghi TaxID=230839 RepID=A0ACC0WLK6_9STRA|nr:hypothetical protein PsorP6_011479 [Peronosclerospora sorghi]